MNFIKEYNLWVTGNKAIKMNNSIITDNIYDTIELDNWCALSDIKLPITNKSKAISFMHNNVNYYFSDISLDKVLKIKKIPIIQVLYDPDIINQTIFRNDKVVSDNRQKLIYKSIYKSYLYQLVLLEFMILFNKERNVTLRKQLKKILMKNINKDFNDIMEDISKIITDCNDYDKIKIYICEYINTHHSKNTLFNDIGDTVYNFDKITLAKLKTLPKNKIYKELEKLSAKFVTYGDINKIKDFEFPNMFISCQDNNNNEKYCKKKKFIIDKTKIKSILEILSVDLLNPIKEKWLFNSILINNVVHFFKFIRRLNENINIEIVE
jgi:hypothetical protein